METIYKNLVKIRERLDDLLLEIRLEKNEK